MVDRIATPDRLLERTPAPSTSPAPANDFRQWITPVEKFIGDHPGPCLASAVIVGVALAWWIKRR
jgi:hypothetical protein